MKWLNKGHEYDAVYEQIDSKNAFYLFGAGDYGTQFYRSFCDEISIKGYMDNDFGKQDTLINGLKCVAVSDVKLECDEAIILTMSQIARVKPLEQLQALGYKKNIDFFIIEEFISVYYLYKYNKVYFSSISFLPSTRCNLNCRHCLNFNPFAKEFYVREWEKLVADVDLFFKHVDHIMLFHISGGEPFLYKHTAQLIDYIDKNYKDKIETLRMVTNGTVVPTDETLEILSRCDIEITVDDYREAIPKYSDNFQKLLAKLKQYGISYYCNRVESWIDLAPEKTDYSMWSEEKLIKHRDMCTQSWQELRDGKLYSCNYAAYATVAGIAGEEDIEETFSLMGEVNKKELVEFRLGYTTKGYTNFCMKCRGFTPYNNEEVEPAKQV